MWTTFFPDLLVAAAGAILTVVIAAGTFVIARRRQEVQSIRDLIDDLHHRRAFSIQPRELVDATAESTDYIWATQSVIDARNLATVTRRGVRPGSKARPELSKIIAACNEYLETSQADPEAYVIGLMDARASVTAALKNIVAVHKSLTLDEPGIGAYPG